MGAGVNKDGNTQVQGSAGQKSGIGKGGKPAIGTAEFAAVFWFRSANHNYNPSWRATCATSRTLHDLYANHDFNVSFNDHPHFSYYYVATSKSLHASTTFFTSRLQHLPPM